MSDTIILIQSIRKILIDDNTDPDVSKGLFSIHHFAKDNIFMRWSPLKPIPDRYFTVGVDYNGGVGGLPADEIRLLIDIWVKRENPDSILDTERMTVRQKVLLKENVSTVNSQGFDTKCRLIDFIDVIPFEESIRSDKLYRRTSLYKVVLGT